MGSSPLTVARSMELLLSLAKKNVAIESCKEGLGLKDKEITLSFLDKGINIHYDREVN